MRIILRLFILINIVFSTLGNRHEHFQSWPTGSSILEGYQNTHNGQSIGEIEYSSLVSKKDSVSTLETLFSPKEIERLEASFGLSGINNKELRESEFQSRLQGKSLKQLVKLMDPIPENESEQLKRFFRFKDKEDGDKKSYQAIENIRRELFRSEKAKNPNTYKKFLKNVYSNSAQKINPENRKFIGMTVPGELFGPELSIVKETLKEKGSQTHFYESITRSTFIWKKNSDVNTALRGLEQGLAEGWADGIDITGSIKEEDLNVGPEKKRELIKSRLEQMVKTLDGKENTVLRFHAFEGANKGVLYDEIFNVMEKVATGKMELKGKPPVFSIGHIAKLSPSDVDRFAKIKKLSQQNNIPYEIVFDVNFQSNKKLQNTDPEKLISTIRRLKNAGLSVAFGSDGTGILGNSSSDLMQALALEEKGLSSEHKEELLKESKKAPVCDLHGNQKLIEEFADGLL